MQNKPIMKMERISKGGTTEVDIDAQVRRAKENAEKRRMWDEEFARKKEEEGLRLAREELAREKKRRLDSWMSNGGDPADFDRAWPSMQAAILEERYRSRRNRAEDLFA
jgi:hypothetical protein